jgi:hypothetical protein
MQNTQEQAKHALVGIIKMNISKYAVLQKAVNDILVSGQQLTPVKGQKKKNCKLCLINEMLGKMSHHQDVAGEAAKTFRILFNEEIDMNAIVDKCASEVFRSTDKEKKGTSSTIIKKDNVIMPEDAPEEVKDICEAIQKILKANGKEGDMTVEVVNMKGENYGLNPENFDSFGDYARAVSKAREEAHAIEHGDKSAEEVIKDAIIHKVENEHFDSNKHTTDEKLN